VYFFILGKHIEPIGMHLSSVPFNRHGNTHTGITATSLDNFSVGTRNSPPPPWIDPFSSGTYSQSRTPFFNWESLMSSSTMNNMAHGMGLIPTIQLGEGIPFDSVKVVAGSNNNKGVNQNSQHIDNVQLPADFQLPPQTPPDVTSNIPLIKRMRASSTNVQNNDLKIANNGPLALSDVSKLESKFGIDPRLLSLQNPATLDPSLLSPDNPSHADLIDFMITRDMALGGHEGAVHTQPLDQNPFDVNQQSSDNVPIVLPHEISPPDGAVFVDQTTVDPSLVTSNTIESNIQPKENGKQLKETKKQQRQKKRQQKKAQQQQNRGIRRQERKKKQKQRQKKQQRRVKNPKIFDKKLAARKLKFKEQRIKRKLKQQLKKLDNLHKQRQQNDQISGTKNNGKHDQISEISNGIKLTAMNTQAFNVETKEKQQRMQPNKKKQKVKEVQKRKRNRRKNKKNKGVNNKKRKNVTNKRNKVAKNKKRKSAKNKKDKGI